MAASKLLKMSEWELKMWPGGKPYDIILKFKKMNRKLFQFCYKQRQI